MRVAARGCCDEYALQPKMSSRMRSCKGTVAGRAPHTRTGAALVQPLDGFAVAASKLWLKREYQELRQADPDGQPQLWAWLFHLSHAAWLRFAEPKSQRSFHGIGAGLRSYIPGLLNSWTTRLSWAGATEATRVWAGAAKKAQDALRLSELAWIAPPEGQQLPASRHWDATQWGATSVKQEMQIFRGTRTSAGWCLLLHAYCWKKVWLSEVPCQHTTSSQHVQACLIGLETTSNTARGVFRAIPCGLCHRIPVLPQWEALLCSKITFLPQWQRSWDFAFGEYYSISHRRFSGTLSFWCSFRILVFLAVPGLYVPP